MLSRWPACSPAADMSMGSVRAVGMDPPPIGPLKMGFKSSSASATLCHHAWRDDVFGHERGGSSPPLHNRQAHQPAAQREEGGRDSALGFAGLRHLQDGSLRVGTPLHGRRRLVNRWTWEGGRCGPPDQEVWMVRVCRSHRMAPHNCSEVSSGESETTRMMESGSAGRELVSRRWWTTLGHRGEEPQMRSSEAARGRKTMERREWRRRPHTASARVREGRREATKECAAPALMSESMGP